jgi:hypothetical protein
MIIIGNSTATIVPAIFVTKVFVYVLDMKYWSQIESLLFLSLLMAAALVNSIGI